MAPRGADVDVAGGAMYEVRGYVETDPGGPLHASRVTPVPPVQNRQKDRPVSWGVFYSGPTVCPFIFSTLY